jgi:hypothetical protein
MSQEDTRTISSSMLKLARCGLGFLVDSTWDGDISGNSLEGGDIWMLEFVDYYYDHLYLEFPSYIRYTSLLKD